MFEQNHRIAKWLLCCTAALLSAGCATTGSYPRDLADCRRGYLHYCQHSGHGTRCGCVPTQTMEAILRRHQQPGL
jgi:hypothetical protein